MSEDSRKTSYMVYMGLRLKFNSTSELLMYFGRLPGDDPATWPKPSELECGVYLDNKRPRVSKRFIVGGVYEIQVDGTSAYFNDAIRQYGVWINDDDIIRWKAMDRASRDAVESNRRYADVDLDALEPFQRAYDLLPPPARAALLTRIIRKITTGN